MSVHQYNDHRDFYGERVTIGHADTRHAYAYPDGSLSLYEHGQPRREIQARSYRRAVRLLRMFINGYNV